MIKEQRKWFNENFDPEKYNSLLQQFENYFPGALDFRLAETPVFIDNAFKEKMLSACESIVDVITQFNFKQLTAHAIPADIKVPDENSHTDFIAFDFGVCIGKDGELEPQLIEMQGFPSLFAYQVLLGELIRKTYDIPDRFTEYFNGYDKHSYLRLLKEIIIGDCAPENVILLEIFPHQQKTRIDFYCTAHYLNIPIVNLTDLIKKGKKLYYEMDGRKIEVKRIYNRVIFDELQQQPQEVQEKGKIFFEELDVEWIPHPNWFYRISKFTLPYIFNPYVPRTKFVSDLKSIPDDLENYVLKPLFSFAGQGVVIDVSKEDIESIKDPYNWILQKKVQYADVIETPDSPAKLEIRVFYFWKQGAARPEATLNLVRLSKGKMIGVRYNKDKEWVGGGIAFFEQ